MDWPPQPSETPAAAVEDGEDVFYEEIEAPKFVDFKKLNRYRPDDRFWFCMRVGCDRKHEEELDAEQISKNFILRVMAARSPNVRLRKALDRASPSSNKKCPLTAPAKPSRPRLLRPPLVSPISQKLKDAEVKFKQPVKPAKSSTTPRNKSGAANPSSTRCVPCLEMTTEVPMNRAAAKALVFKSKPEKVSQAAEVPLRKMSKGIRRVKKQPREIKRDYSRPWSVKAARPWSTRTQVHGNSDSSMKYDQGEAPVTERADNSGAVLSADVLKCQPEEKIKVPGHMTQGDGHDNKENGTDVMENDNKENVSAFLENSERKRLSSHGTFKQKVMMQATQALKDQCFKERPKPTNPKPFRLRTDERMILKEAHFEKRRLNETATAGGFLGENSQTKTVKGFTQPNRLEGDDASQPNPSPRKNGVVGIRKQRPHNLKPHRLKSVKEEAPSTGSPIPNKCGAMQTTKDRAPGSSSRERKSAMGFNRSRKLA